MDYTTLLLGGILAIFNIRESLKCFGIVMITEHIFVKSQVTNIFSKIIFSAYIIQLIFDYFELKDAFTYFIFFAMSLYLVMFAYIQVSGVNVPEIEKRGFLISLVMPYFEESLFRRDLPFLMRLINIPYTDQICSGLFGISHLTNYLDNYNIYFSIYSAISAGLGGYYLAYLKNFHQAIIFHVCWNYFACLIQILLYESYESYNNDNTTTIFHHRSRSLDVTQKEKQDYTFSVINKQEYDFYCELTKQINLFYEIKK